MLRKDEPGSKHYSLQYCLQLGASQLVIRSEQSMTEVDGKDTINTVFEEFDY